VYKTYLDKEMIDPPGMVLVVCNEQDPYASTAASLRRVGYNVQFRNGRDLAGLADEKANLIISELAQPELDGLQLCRHVRERYQAFPTWVLLVGDLSARSTIVADALKCGADAYVQRPTDPNELSLICLNLLTGPRTIFTSNDHHRSNSRINRFAVKVEDQRMADGHTTTVPSPIGSKWNILDHDDWPIDRDLIHSN
jgi:DNA-binding response OmpR family regulator